jgi:hypothetical protein
MSGADRVTLPREAAVALQKRCLCFGKKRRIPIQLRAHALFTIREALEEYPSTNLVVLTYRCSACTSTVEITAGDLLLSETST